MGFGLSQEQPPIPGDRIWREHRAQFPVTQHVIYLNHAAVAPLCLPAAEAMKKLTDDVTAYGALHYSTWLACYEGLRAAAARLIGATPDEIAIVKNTSEGIAVVANGIAWNAGDIVVAFREEFPANYYPWKRLESKGVEIRWLSAGDPLERIEDACRGARLLTVSFVQYLSGYRAPLEEIGAICHRHGCLYFVDAIQGLGAFNIDVEKAGIHALAADGHKWLLGPEGCGILYVGSGVQDQIEPVEFGWTNVAGYADYANRDMTLRRDAGRYECGTLNTAGCFGLRASIEFLLSVGIGNIAAHVQDLGDRIAEGVSAQGYDLLCSRTPSNGAGIVSFRKPGLDSRLVVSKLQEAGIAAAPRQGWVRASPHFYISPDDIAAFLGALP